MCDSLSHENHHYLRGRGEGGGGRQGGEELFFLVKEGHQSTCHQSADSHSTTVVSNVKKVYY